MQPLHTEHICTTYVASNYIYKNKTYIHTHKYHHPITKNYTYMYNSIYMSKEINSKVIGKITQTFIHNILTNIIFNNSNRSNSYILI